VLQELHRRIKNEFAAAISVASLATAAPAITKPRPLCRQSRSCCTCGIVLEGETYLRQLCLSISRSYLDHRKIKLVLASEPLRLRSDRCWCFAIIVYELITNSARHAFSGGVGGSLAARRGAGCFGLGGAVLPPARAWRAAKRPRREHRTALTQAKRRLRRNRKCDLRKKYGT
jgi:hypothetical protein